VALLAAGAALAEPAPGPGALGFEPPLPGTYALPPLGRAGDGAVLTSRGEPARLHDLLGQKLVALSFVYTSCADASGCPFATAVLDRVRKRASEAPDLAGRVRLVSLSFDPSHDTPEVLRRHERALLGEHTGPGVEWHFLTTASEAELEPILAAYGQSLTREPPESPGSAAGAIAHVLRVFLIDRAGRIRNIYSSSFLHVETLIADLRTLLLEEERGAGLAR
jgi:cytochrome c peroxidase